MRISDDNEHSCHAEDREMMGGGMQPFSSIIRQGHFLVVRRDHLACQRPHDGRLLWGNRVPLVVAKHIVAASHPPEHVKCSLIGEDESSISVDDEQRNTHVVKNCIYKYMRPWCRPHVERFLRTSDRGPAPPICVWLAVVASLRV